MYIVWVYTHVFVLTDVGLAKLVSSWVQQEK